MTDIVSTINPTMSSREIAELTGKQHQHVKRDIEKMLDDLKEDASRFGHIYFDSMNRQKTEYLLDRDHVDCLLTGYSAQARMIVIKRWRALEQEKNLGFDPNDEIAVLENLVETKKRLAIAGPKAEVFDRIVDRGVLMTATQVGQKVGISAMKLNQYLSMLDVYNGNVKRAKAFKQWFVDKKFGEMKQTELGYSQPLFTNAGEMWIVEQLTSEGVI